MEYSPAPEASFFERKAEDRRIHTKKGLFSKIQTWKYLRIHSIWIFERFSSFRGQPGIWKQLVEKFLQFTNRGVELASIQKANFYCRNPS